MCAFDEKHAQQLGSIEAKLDLMIPVIQRQNERIGALEKWRSWMAGVGSVFVLIWTAVRTGFIQFTNHS